MDFFVHGSEQTGGLLGALEQRFDIFEQDVQGRLLGAGRVHPGFPGVSERLEIVQATLPSCQKAGPR